jgi:hypothetical protein
MEQEEPRKRSLTGTAKLDATTEAAYEIIDKKVQDRDLKTARLKAQRLERDAQEALRRAGEPPKKKPRKLKQVTS